MAQTNMEKTIMPDKDNVTFNKEVALRMMGGSEKLLVSTLEKFVKKYCHISDELSALLVEQDVAALTRLAHSLKGMGATIGAEKLSYQAGSLEKWLTQHNESWLDQEKFDLGLKPLLKSLAENYSLLHIEIDEYLRVKCEKNDAPLNRKIDKEEALKEIAVLKQMLKTFDAFTYQYWTERSAQFQHLLGASNFEQFDQLIECFDFDIVLERLESLNL
ncbi:Hpt domain-containing protein [Thiomicrorhabdus sp. 6S3-12]|uniref:Hpt domain-containing protein n=1 Tax=Thiomicrorhabdus sp. 6S3-12 TaxID=2819681 RepID=UPI001AAD6C83|nr:Hpt domain-containing protein [Thiomicrorhabdus sp. 6S3-12]MBO1923380.1 Hpt domain-containing protein [Thiomicrorhabdus sp. 6S3-12]